MTSGEPALHPSAGARVLVTGGSSGLGEALVRAYRGRGARVLVTDIAVDEPGSGDSPARHLDVRSDEDWAAARDWVQREWGGLDVLVNNAGVAGGGRVDVAELDEWQWITEINLFGVVRGVRAFTPVFKQQRSGTIVNVASLAGLVHPAGMGSYNAVKAGVVAFTETVGHELAAYGVRASVVCPSYFRTGLMDSVRGRDTELAAVMTHLVESSPVSADDVAAEVIAGLDAGEQLILPDAAARDAWRLKRTDRVSYDALMRAQAAKLHRAGR